MLRILTHRGPDDRGFYQDTHVGLGNARLSIIDLLQGHQPLCNETGEIWITFNGEIFNFRVHRARLEASGHAFTTNSDTEVLVHLYEEDGLDFVSKLNGMFAFALWDARTRQLVLARDYAGMKPLYYTRSPEGTFYFASEVKALLTLQASPQPNLESLGDFLLLGYLPYGDTLFKGVYKLRPGELLVLDAEHEELREYSSFRARPLISEANEVELNVARELTRATKDWLMADVPVGAYVSGGLDSSIIATLAARQTTKKLRTYTAWFGPDFANELRAAQELTDHLGFEHTEVLVEESEVLHKLPEIAWFYDEPIAEAAVIPTYFVSREASKNVKVVLAGEGADELFGGYPWYQMFEFTRWLALTKRLNGGTVPSDPHIETHLSGLLRPGYSLTQRYLTFHSVIPPAEIKRLIPSASHSKVFKIFRRYLEEASQPQLARLQLCDTMTLLADSFMMKADKGSMANSVEERTPYLDKHLMELAFRVPTRMKIALGTEKIILRKIGCHLLPRSTAKRRKRGYGTPVKGWVAAEIGAYLGGLVEESHILNRVLNHERTSRISASRKRFPKQFWMLGSVALWEKTFLDGKRKPAMAT